MKTVLDTIYNTYHTMSHSGQESAIDNSEVFLGSIEKTRFVFQERRQSEYLQGKHAVLS